MSDCIADVHVFLPLPPPPHTHTPHTPQTPVCTPTEPQPVGQRVATETQDQQVGFHTARYWASPCPSLSPQETPRPLPLPAIKEVCSPQAQPLSCQSRSRLSAPPTAKRMSKWRRSWRRSRQGWELSPCTGDRYTPTAPPPSPVHPDLPPLSLQPYRLRGIDDLEIVKKIGSGPCGEVFLIRHKATGCEMAAKVSQPALSHVRTHHPCTRALRKWYG